MRVLLSLMALILWPQVVLSAGILRPPSLVRPQGLILQSYAEIAQLQREVDMLVARGYVLFAGEFLNEELEGVTGKEFLLIRDNDSPVYRYGEDEVAAAGSSVNFNTKGIAEGGRAPLGGDGKDVNVKNFIYIPHNATDAERSRLGWYYFRLQTADEAYPENPAAVDTLKLITEARTVDLHPVNHYRVYQGRLDWPRLPGSGHTSFVETITINGNNPYIIYRHTARLHVGYYANEGTVVEADRLTIGIYPYLAVEPFIVEEKTVLSEGVDIVSHDNGRYQLISDNKDNMTLKYRDNEIPLQLIKDADVWNAYEGNPGTTGAGIESMLAREYFNGESSAR